MKIVQKILMFSCIHFFHIFGDDFDLEPYDNQIVDIQETVGMKKYTLLLSCSHKHPVVVYAPSNFAQSCDESEHRYLLPNTTFSSKIQNDRAHLQQVGMHVEVLLFGKLLYHATSEYGVIFIVADDGA